MLRSLLRPRISLLLLALILGAPTAPLSAADPVPFKLIGMKLYPDTPEGHAGTPFDRFEFQDTQQQQYAMLTFDSAAAGRKVKVDLIATKTTLGIEKTVKSFDEAIISPEGKLPISVKLPRAWPVGWYRYEIRCENQFIGRAGYKVVAADPKSTPITLQKFHLFRDKPDGSLEETPKAKVTDRHLYFAAETKGARTNGAKVSWALLYLEGQEGKQRKAAGVDINDWPLDDTTVSFDVALDKDWPNGRYLLQLRVDDQPIGNFAFLIGDPPAKSEKTDDSQPPAK